MMDYVIMMKKTITHWVGRHCDAVACKAMVKQCLCGSGMRWKNKGAKVIWSWRALVQSKGCWQ